MKGPHKIVTKGHYPLMLVGFSTIYLPAPLVTMEPLGFIYWDENTLGSID